MLLAACGGTKDAGKTDQVLIEKSDIKIEGKRMTPEALWDMGRIGGFAVSPDGKKIAYTVAYYSVPENKSNREVFVMNADGSENQQITRTPYQENEVTWIKGGTKLAFLSNDNGSSQLYEMNPDGSGRKQLTSYDGDIEGYSISPDGKKLLFISQVKTKESTADKYPDLPKATGIIVTDLMYKHWDEWVTTAPHPFIADFDGNGISNIVDILNDEPYESPMKPWGGIEQLAWNTTSDKVAYTCRKKTGLEYAISTNSDIYIYDLNTKKTENITEENKGYDTNPQYSPDGKYIAWQSMERDGYEADLNRLFIMNLETGIACIYVNGQLQSQTQVAPTVKVINLGLRAIDPDPETDARQFFIGYSYDAFRQLCGDISEVRIWSVARTQADIWRDMYDVENPAEKPELRAYWKFNEGSGNIIKDWSQYGNDAVAHTDLKWNTSVEIPQLNKQE